MAAGSWQPPFVKTWLEKACVPRRVKLAARWLVICLLLYVVTVGAVPAIARHMGDSGRLQWLPSVPGAVWFLEAYEWPAKQLSCVRPCHCLFEFTASVWWSLLDPPDTTP